MFAKIKLLCLLFVLHNNLNDQLTQTMAQSGFGYFFTVIVVFWNFFSRSML